MRPARRRGLAERQAAGEADEAGSVVERGGEMAWGDGAARRGEVMQYALSRSALHCRGVAYQTADCGSDPWPASDRVRMRAIGEGRWFLLFLSAYYIQWWRDAREEGRLGRDGVMGSRGNRVGELPISLAGNRGRDCAR